MEKRKSERGSITLYVLIAMLFFTLLAMGIFLALSNKQTSQKQDSVSISQEYGKQDPEQAYQERSNQDSSWKDYPRNGLVLQYDGIQNTKLGHSSQTTIWEDLSENGNNGTLQNIQNGANSGWKENCLSFDGSNDMVRTNLASSLKSQAYTIELLVSRKQIVNNTRSIVFVSWEGMTIEMNNTNTLTFGTNASNSYLQANSLIQNGKPYQITCVYANGTQKIYIDGILNATKTISGTAPFSDTVLTLGSWKGTDPFMGDVYAVRMYNRELSANEIKKNHQTDQKRFAQIFADGYAQEGLIMQLDAIDNTGGGHSNSVTTWKDISGHGRDVTLAGGTWTTTGLTLDGVDDGVNLSDKLKNLFKANNTIEVSILFSQTSARDIIFGNYNNTNSISYEKGPSDTNFVRVNYPAYQGTSGTYFKANTKYVLSYVWDKSAGEVIQYINGAQYKVYSSTEIQNFNADFTGAWIGRDYRTGDGTPTKGTLYGFRAYNRKLSEQEIKNNYEMEKARYRF